MTHVGKFYASVINDVIEGVKDDFADEGCEPNILLELKRIWETKLSESRALNNDPPEQAVQASQYAALLQQQKLVSASNILRPIATVPVNAASGGSFVPITPQTRPIQPTGGPRMLSEPAQVAAMALPTNVYHQNVGQMNPSAVSLPSGHLHIPRTQGMNYADYSRHQQPIHSYPTRPLAYGYQRPGQMFTISGQPGNQPAFLVQQQNGSYISMTPAQMSAAANQGASAPVTTSGGDKGFVAAIKNQLDGAGDSSSESDDDDDLIPVGRSPVASRRPGGRANILLSPPAPHSTLTGAGDEEDDDLDDEEVLKEDVDNVEEEAGNEEEPLNSGDDVSDEETDKIFETDNVVVCQYDKISRSKTKWRFHLKDGIMTINTKDYVFQKANGEAEW